MLKTAIAALAALATLPALAVEVRTGTPIEAKSLATDDVHLVAYFVPAGDLYEVTATWVDADTATPNRLVLSLDDGDQVHFALPGHPRTLYTFSRKIDTVTISADPATGEIRNASL